MVPLQAVVVCLCLISLVVAEEASQMADKDPAVRFLRYFGISAAIGLVMGAVITFLILSCLTQKARAALMGLPDLPRGSQSNIDVLTMTAASSAPLDADVCSSIAHDASAHTPKNFCSSLTVAAASSHAARWLDGELSEDCTSRAHTPMEATVVAVPQRTPSAPTSRHGSLPQFDSFIGELVDKRGHLKRGRLPPISVQSRQATPACLCLPSSVNQGHVAANTVGGSDLDEELCFQV